MAMPSPSTPQKIGRYEIRGELGKGAMGVVYKAEDPNIGRAVALKTMRLDVHGMEAEEMLLRFKNEARAAGILNHSNIVTIYDAGEHEGLFYIAMEFIEGVTLQKVLNDQGILPVEQVLDLSRQICAGLDYAHSHKIIHRDVKPANIMIERDGRVKIMDFGIAKAEGAQLTTAGQVVGTPNYMSPEQVKGKPLDGRSDLWSFGVMLYEMVTGEKPFGGQNVTTIIYKIVNENPIPPKDLDSSVHPGLSAVIQRALAKNPDQRYQKGADLVNHLANYKSIGTETASLLADAGSAHVAKAAAPEAAAAAKPAPAPAPPAVPAPAAGKTPPAPAAKPAPLPAAKAAAKPAPVKAAQPHDSSATLVAGSHESSKIAAMIASAREAMARLDPNQWLMIAAGVLVLALVGIAFGVYRSSKQLPVPAAALEQAQPTPQPAPPQTTQAPAQEPASAPESSEAAPPEGEKAKPRTKTLAKAAAPAAVPTPAAQPPAAAPVNGTMRLISNPAGAKVEIDGWSQPDWVTPFSSPNLSVGKHKVVMTKPGFVDDSRMVEIAAGSQVLVAVTLKVTVLPSRIEVKSEPPGAAIIVDGKDTGKQTPSIVEVTKGDHNVELRKLGYVSTNLAATVGEGETAHLSQPLKAGTGGANPLGKLFGGGIPEGMGALQVKSKPKGATVTVNGENAPRTTPFKIVVDPGSYKVVVSLEGYQPSTQSITVEKGKTANVEVELTK